MRFSPTFEEYLKTPSSSPQHDKNKKKKKTSDRHFVMRVNTPVF